MLERINKTFKFPKLKNGNIIIFTDLHFHKHKASNIFLPIIENVLNEIIKEAEKFKSELILFLGDWFENKEKVGTEELVLSSRFFNELNKRGISIVLIPGNHDKFLKSNSKTLMTTIETFNAIENVYCINEPQIVNYKDKAFHLYPHSDSLQAIDIEKTIDKSKKNYFFGHPELNNVQMSNGTDAYINTTDVDTKFLNENFVMSFIGHYHNAKKYGKILSVGSPYQQNFGETENKNYILNYNIDTDKVTAIPNTFSPRFVKVLISDLKIKTEEDFNKITVKDSFVRIIMDKSMDSSLLLKLKEHMGKNNLSVEMFFDYDEKPENKEDQTTDDLRKKLNVVDLTNSQNIKDFFNTYLDIFPKMPDKIEKEKLKTIISEVS